MKRILVLSSAESGYTEQANRQFVEQIAARLEDVTIETCHYRDIAFVMDEEQIYAKRLSTNEGVNAYDLVYFKSFHRYSEMASALAHYLQQEGIRYVCHEIDDAISFSKLTQYARLSRHKLPIIATVFVERTMWQKGVALIEASFGFPCIFKATDAKGGDANYMPTNADELLAIAAEHDCDFVAQEFIPNDYDLRVLIAGGEVRRVIKRQRIDDSSHLNNTSKGAEATLVPEDNVSIEIREVSCRAAALFKREIAGVDIMSNRDTGKIHILEVNASPQVATGAFQSEKLDVYAELFKALLQLTHDDTI